MRLQRSVIALVLGIMLVLGGSSGYVAFAEPGMRHRGGPHGKMEGRHGFLPGIFRGANLSQEQRQQLHTIHKAHEATLEGIEDDISEVRRSLAVALMNPAGVTAADLQPLSEQLSALIVQLSQERLAIALEMRAILTPEQVTAAAERLQKK